MIRYTLNCAKRHEFEGWFRNSDAYERQSKRGEIRCPECGSSKIKKAIMAPAVTGTAAAPSPPQAAASATPAEAPAALPASPAASPEPSMPPMHFAGKMHEALREMRNFIEKNATYVGPRFAAEARKMHQGESKERSIYGEASEKEAQELREEGIEFGRLPWPKHRTDA
jgi:hypothetical protein